MNKDKSEDYKSEDYKSEDYKSEDYKSEDSKSEDYTTIVEAYYNQVEQVFIVRFLDGTTHILPRAHIPRPELPKTSIVCNCDISSDKQSLIVHTESECWHKRGVYVIPSYVFARGKTL